jgi:hypothetical protein
MVEIVVVKLTSVFQRNNRRPDTLFLAAGIKGGAAICIEEEVVNIKVEGETRQFVPLIYDGEQYPPVDSKFVLLNQLPAIVMLALAPVVK